MRVDPLYGYLWLEREGWFGTRFSISFHAATIHGYDVRHSLFFSIPTLTRIRHLKDNAREAEPVDGICTIKVILEWKRWVEQAVSTSELVEQPDLSRPIHGDKAEVLCSLDAVELGPPRPDAHFPGLPDPSFVSESAGLKPEVFMFHYASRGKWSSR